MGGSQEGHGDGAAPGVPVEGQPQGQHAPGSHLQQPRRFGDLRPQSSGAEMPSPLWWICLCLSLTSGFKKPLRALITLFGGQTEGVGGPGRGVQSRVENFRGSKVVVENPAAHYNHLES